MLYVPHKEPRNLLNIASVHETTILSTKSEPPSPDFRLSAFSFFIDAFVVFVLRRGSIGLKVSVFKALHLWPSSIKRLTLSIKIAQKPYIIGSLGPKALKYESLEGKGKMCAAFCNAKGLPAFCQLEGSRYGLAYLEDDGTY